jgi:hypothetical protein
MATDIVTGMFGPSPYEIQQQRQAALENAALQYAKLDPMQRATIGLYKAGGMLGGAVGGALGMEDPAVAQAKAREAAMSGIDYNDPKSILERAAQTNDPRIKLRLQMLAQERADALRKEEADRVQMELNRAHAEHYKRGGATGSLGLDARYTLKIMDAANSARNAAIKVADERNLSGMDREDFINQQVSAAVEGAKALAAAGGMTTGQPAVAPATPMVAAPAASVPRPDQPTTPVMAYPSPDADKTAMLDEQAANLAVRLQTLTAEKKKYANDPAAVAAIDTEIKDTNRALAALDKQASGAAPTIPSKRVLAPSKVDVAAQTEAAKNVAKGMSDVKVKDYTSVIDAPVRIAKIDDLITQINAGNINTGSVADIRQGFDKAIALLGGKDAAKRASNTEILDVLMGSDVFPLIQSLGIGARGMDTPAEREFLRGVMTGTINLEKSTLLRMANMRKAVETDKLRRWNERVDSGELDSFFKSADVPKRKIMYESKTASKPTAASSPSKRIKFSDLR